MNVRTLNLMLLAVIAGSFSSCAPEGPQRKKVVGPDSSAYSNLPWNRPKPWEANARYGGMMPTSR